MTATERKRRSRLRAMSVEAQIAKVARAFGGVSEEARTGFLGWLRKHKFLK